MGMGLLLAVQRGLGFVRANHACEWIAVAASWVHRHQLAGPQAMVGQQGTEGSLNSSSEVRPGIILTTPSRHEAGRQLMIIDAIF